MHPQRDVEGEAGLSSAREDGVRTGGVGAGWDRAWEPRSDGVIGWGAEEAGGWEPALASARVASTGAPDRGQPGLASAAEEVRTLPAVGGHGGPDGADVEANVSSYLDFLSRLCRELGVPDPVEEYFAPVVGRWSDMHAEAERWRATGVRAELVADSLTKPLGGLDAAWDGADAETFIDYMNKVGLAGHDMSDAMAAMAEVLDTTADGIREIVQDMAGLLAEVAESTSQSMAVPVQGDDRTRQYLDEMKRPTRELFEAVRQVLEALVRLCDGIDGSQVFEPVTMAHTFPADNWAFQVDVPAIPGEAVPSDTAPAAADAAALTGGGGGAGLGGGGGGIGGGGAGGGGGPSQQAPQGGNYVMAGEALPGRAGGMPVGGAAAAAAEGGAGGRSGGMMGGGMPMGGGMGGQQGGGTEHKSRTRVVGDPGDIFGKPTKASPSVIGDD